MYRYVWNDSLITIRLDMSSATETDHSTVTIPLKSRSDRHSALYANTIFIIFLGEIVLALQM